MTLGMFSCDCIFTVSKIIFRRDFHIPRNNTERHSSVPEQRLATVFAAIFTVGGFFFLFFFFFFLSTALYSIYARRATAIKLLLRRCDTRSAATLAVYYNYIGIYRLIPTGHHRTPRRRCQILNMYTCLGLVFSPFIRP